MRITHKIIGFLSIFVIVLCFFFLPKLEESTEDKKIIDLIGFDVEGSEGTYRINIFEDTEDIYYVFLPSYTNAEKVSVNIAGSLNLIINGTKVSNGEYIRLPHSGQEYSLIVSDKKESKYTKGKIKFLISKNLPAVYLTTKSGSMKFVNSDKENKEEGYIIVTAEDGRELYSGRVDKFSGRGNTSWDAEKKSYSLDLRSGADLLGMERAKKWILIANYYDGAFIRNKLGFQIAEGIGLNNTPDSRFVDLYINGQYWGLYQLTEKIEIGQNRINIGNGYLMEIDYPERAFFEKNVIYLENGQPIVIHNPGKLTDSQISFLQTWYKDMLGAIYAEDYVNPETGKGIFEYLDKESFAKMYLVDEILEDMDFGVTSHYMYMNSGKDSVLHAGPVWDLDNTMGRGFDKRNEFFANSYSLSSNQVSRWYARLCGNEEFCRTILNEWKENVSPMMEYLTEKEIDNLINELEASIQMDSFRWPGQRSRFMPQADLAENIIFLKTYLRDRQVFLDDAFLTNEEATVNFMKKESATLPDLEKIEKYQPENKGEIPESDTTSQKDYNILGSHYIILFLVMLLWGAVLMLLDIKRNGKANGK